MTRVRIEDFDPGPQDPFRWNTAIDSAMAQADTVLLDGSAYAFKREVVLSKAATIEGASVLGTLVAFHTVGDAGFGIPITGSRSELRRMTIQGPNPLVGKDVGVDVGGSFCKFNDLRVQHWSGQGVRFMGNVQSNTNANKCSGTDVELRFCGHGKIDGNPYPDGAGVLCIGGDANACSFTNWHAHDCRRGIVDKSFLGNVWTACHAEGCYNKHDDPPPPEWTFCGFETTDPNTQSTFIGCYTEQDSVANINGLSMMFGGFMINRGTGLQVGRRGAERIFEVRKVFHDANASPPRGMITHARLGGPSDGDAFAVSVTDAITGANVSLPHTLRWNQSALGWWAFNYGNLAQCDAYRFRESSFWVPRDFRLGRSATNTGYRVVYAVSLEAALASGPPMSSPDDPWRNGDRVVIAEPAVGQPCEYVRVGSQWCVCGRVEQ